MHSPFFPYSRLSRMHSPSRSSAYPCPFKEPETHRQSIYISFRTDRNPCVFRRNIFNEAFAPFRTLQENKALVKPVRKSCLSGRGLSVPALRNSTADMLRLQILPCHTDIFHMYASLSFSVSRQPVQVFPGPGLPGPLYKVFFRMHCLLSDLPDRMPDHRFQPFRRRPSRVRKIDLMMQPFG